jgi:hypothetical protein
MSMAVFTRIFTPPGTIRLSPPGSSNVTFFARAREALENPRKRQSCSGAGSSPFTWPLLWPSAVVDHRASPDLSRP